MTTPRRSFLSVLALAPLAGVAQAAPAGQLPRDLTDLGVGDLLRLGASEDTDRTFASLCRAALPAYEAELRAWSLFQDANEKARSMAPFPAALDIPRVWQRPDGPAQVYTDRWDPESRTAVAEIRFLARPQLREKLGRWPTGDELHQHEAALRNLWDTWSRANAEAEAACLVPDLRAAADAAADLSEARIGAALAHTPRSVAALRIKCCLRWSEGPADTSVFDAWQTIVADVEAALS